MNQDDDLMLLEWEDDSSLLLNSLEDASSSFQPYANDQNISQVSTKGEHFLQQIDEDLDFAFALALQTQYEDETKENTISNSKKSCAKDPQPPKPLSIIDEQWELLDPHPDIHALFQEYDKKFFYGKLTHVEVKWSPRMTSCAGVCSYEGRGGLCSVRLSEPLLKLRPRKDLVETLLHEMIHAYLFVTHNNKDRDGHGPEFQSHMSRINKESGTRITIYHSFHDEVDLYRQHWWKCNGPCKNKRPYYGILKRAMNRPPGPSDNWWTDHQAKCGGTFVKIKEPDNYAKKKTNKRKASSITESKESPSDIRNFFKDSTSKNEKSRAPSSTTTSNISQLVNGIVVNKKNIENTSPEKTFIPFQGIGHKLGGLSDGHNKIPSYRKENGRNKIVPSSSSSEKPSDMKPLFDTRKIPRLCNSQGNLSKDQKPSTSLTLNNVTRSLVQSPMEKFLSSKNKTINSIPQKNGNKINQVILQEVDLSKVSCPVCSISVKEEDINSHLDMCLS